MVLATGSGVEQLRAMGARQAVKRADEILARVQDAVARWLHQARRAG